ncbi:4-hydroxy-3-methylbut-2-enyl diphosphate reductase [Aminivibrio sp.]|uniref:4-hydroxy-3-methylbut-2-enyl diphosphate reductase n=1 Tax=Aminivibrio sp. TaxID=1872489 RepID=UPI002A1F21BC|nr:4-hydroxy-3-methylbut-2-enyl diphosphate reductase [Synergistaceae bacterium]MDD3390222.1 4-hydroxy-3-methylbut-2-enyl diphosphate reductase [Synergistaceae bacterium]MDD4021512.1 4-hydroxy-3-methylbut-2-enyl diphosphate reductase [Synergistaceae bacterium]MDD4612977.1 4-hydroxy-3-methylbut-2-enyl diphosphate reductase [Synergistaceae bacterium]
MENERKPIEVEVASPTGFCFGVKRAIESLEKCIGESAASDGAGKVYSIGMPIHNPQEVARLSRKGLVVVERIEDVPSGAGAFVRAHGVHPSVKKALLERCCGRVTDATCPFVKNAQEKAALLAKEGYSVLVLGDPNHPEVQAIVGCAGEDVSVASSLSEVKGVGKKDRLGVISQTTQKKEFLGAASEVLAPAVRELRIFNTICGATTQRQDAVRKITGSVDGLIVVGGKNSANTAKLVEIARSRNCDTLWIEHSGELDGRWFAGKARIGIAAGASTPDWLIEELKIALETSQVSRGMEGYDGRNDE